MVTGSINAITTGSAEDINARTFTSDEWLPLGPKEAREMANAYISYCVAKKEAERAVWNYVKEFHPKYSITFLLPPLIFGPPIQYISDIKRMNYSSAQFYGLWSGENEVLPGTGFAGYVRSSLLLFPSLRFCLSTTNPNQ